MTDCELIFDGGIFWTPKKKRLMRADNLPRIRKCMSAGNIRKFQRRTHLFQNGRAKGINGNIEAVSRLSAIPFNRYVEFSQSDFSKLIDSLGGVEFDIIRRI